MKKKWIAVLVSSMLAVSLAGCGSTLSDEYITINKYKKLEIPKLENAYIDRRGESLLLVVASDLDAAKEALK